MKAVFESKGNFENSLAWLERASNPNVSGVLGSFAQDGAETLRDATPKNTGKTAAGWSAQVSMKAGVYEIGWINTAYPGERVNLAILIDQGHGTGTGGYVPAKPYIKRAMNPVWAGIDVKVIRELIR